MGVRPPQQGRDEEPETIAFGIAAIDGYLDRSDLRFPATREEVLERLGDRDVPYDASGNTVRLSSALEEAPTREFETRQELMNALHAVFENRRERTKSSIVGRLWSLVPF